MSIFALPGWKIANFNRNSYHYVHIPAATPEKPTLILFHGCPIGVLTFRKLVPSLVAEGYGVVLPELLGYGASSKPHDVAEYSRIGMATAMAELLEAENVHKVVVLGHDWGAPIAATFALKYRNISERLILIGAPFWPPERNPLDIDLINNTLEPILGFEPLAYMEWLVSDEAATVASTHPEALVRLIFGEDMAHMWCDRGMLERNLKQDVKLPTPQWISEEDMQENIEFVQKQDMSALFKYYHFGTKISEEGNKDLPQRLSLPFLFLECQNDSAAYDPVTSMKDLCDNMTVKSFAAGHWILDEDSEGATKAIIDWLSTGK
ncbi:alpha/beta-hydrolase [Clavulina sp. PMI_390]|nr:alpha/beta-hydrolase [Clavulina sp. PMI_390]